MWLLSNLLWMMLGAATLKVLHAIFDAGREHGVHGARAQEPDGRIEKPLGKPQLVVVLRRAHRDPRADISRALDGDRWN